MTTLALFDLDGTISWRDTLMPFLGGFLRRHPGRLVGLWRVLPALLSYVIHRDRGALKSRVIRAAMGGESRTRIENWADAFVAASAAAGRWRPAALAVIERHRAAGDHLVLLSASPDLYVPRIGAALGFERTLCTEILWRGDRLDGRLKTLNRRGKEKVACLRTLRGLYPGIPVIAYGNSSSDLALLCETERALLVNGDVSARRHAAALGIAVDDWT